MCHLRFYLEFLSTIDVLCTIDYGNEAIRHFTVSPFKDVISENLELVLEVIEKRRS